jgi:hypothetical protein
MNQISHLITNVKEGPVLEMSEVDAAMLEHMKYIVQIEARTFSYLDFETFKVRDRWYHVAHGTCRNKFSELVRKGVIQFEYNSKVAYYTLKGHHFGTSTKMTSNHMGILPVTDVTHVTNGMTDLFDYIHTIPIDKVAAVHDIHYKFTVPDIYKIMAQHPRYAKLLNPVSKDIVLRPEITDGLKIQSIIHRTDTVTVTIACSSNPVTINDAGVLRASVVLTRAEERLSSKLDECGKTLPGGYEKIPIPDNRTWTVTMWHFGKDGRFEYSKKGYSLTWGYGREVLRIYTKSLQGQQIERRDMQEYPNSPFEVALYEKRKHLDNKAPLGTTLPNDVKVHDPSMPSRNGESEKGNQDSNLEVESS